MVSPEVCGVVTYPFEHEVDSVVALRYARRSPGDPRCSSTVFQDNEAVAPVAGVDSHPNLTLDEMRRILLSLDDGVYLRHVSSLTSHFVSHHSMLGERDPERSPLSGDDQTHPYHLPLLFMSSSCFSSGVSQEKISPLNPVLLTGFSP